MIERPDSNRCLVPNTAAPFFDRHGRLVDGSTALADLPGMRQAEEALRCSEALLQAELEDAKLLQQISAALISEENVEALYGRIVDAASAIMRSDFASMQMLYPERGPGGELRLLSHRGFPPEAVRFWAWVRADSNCTCGIALRTGARVIDPDVARSTIMAGTEDQAALLRSGILAAQTTPLVARDGRMLGMITTHWNRPHQPAERELRLMDVLARQAADLLERCRAEEEIKALNARLTSELAAMTRMQQLSTRLVQANDFNLLLEEILDAAIEVTNADMGNVQLLVEGQLRITAQRGFEAPFLEFFQAVHDGQAACGTALRDGRRAIVDDVADSPVFAGTPAQTVMLEAGAFAVQSTPLVSRSGRVLGMFSTHYRCAPRRPNEHELRLLDLLARQAADLIERMQGEDALRQQTERVRLLWEAAAVLLTASDPDAMLHSLFARIGPHLGADVYFNYMVSEAGDALRLASCEGIPVDVAGRIHRPELGQAICGTVALQRQPMVVESIHHSDDPKALLVKSFGIRAYACYPLMADEVLLGTLSFASRRKDRFDSGELAFLRTICQYVTAAYERLRLLDKLRDADRRKDDFLATLAHELRNPLAPVRNAVQVLRLTGPDEPDIQRSRDVIERQVGHLTRLIDDLMDISRITRNKLELRKERVELAEVVRVALETSRPHIEACGHELTVALPREPVYLNGDLVRLTQVFLNLLNNAAKYTERGGRIWLTAERQDGNVIVSVRDTGIGIPGEKLPRLFDMFFQVDRSLEKAQGGLGIGLSLVRRLVEMHGGCVEARSEGVGKGSELIVCLPVSNEAPRAEQWSDSGKNGATYAAPARRILIVDDNRDAADSLAMLLEVTGNEVYTAYDGIDGFEAAERLTPDVVVLDIGMPRLNGYEVCRRLRHEPWGSRPLVIALSGWGQEDDRRRAMEAGFDVHLTKPVDPTALMQLLASRSGAVA